MRQAESPTSDLIDTLCGEGARHFYRGSLVEFFLDEELPTDVRACLGAARELVRRWMREELQHGPLLNDDGAVAEYLRLHFAGEEREVFTCLFLDHHHRLLSADDLFLGTIDGVQVHVREVLKRALRVNAAAVIAAHNHPSGNAEPSEADLALTQRLHDALAMVDTRLVDHLVVGKGSVTSMRARGWT